MTPDQRHETRSPDGAAHDSGDRRTSLRLTAALLAALTLAALVWAARPQTLPWLLPAAPWASSRPVAHS